MRLVSFLTLGAMLAAGFYHIGIIHGKKEIRLQAENRITELKSASERDRQTLRLLQQVSYLQQDVTDLAAKTRELQSRIDERCVERVTVTAYTPSKRECDADPRITASMQSVRAGTVAVSRDLFEDGWVFGKKVYLMGLGIYEITDLMHKRHSKKIDIFMWNKKDAVTFGRRKTTAALMPLSKNASPTPVASLQ